MHITLASISTAFSLNLSVHLSSTVLCTQPPDTGSCRDSLTKWYYRPGKQDCFRFNYGGCPGNENRFDSKESCLTACHGVTGRLLLMLTRHFLDIIISVRLPNIQPLRHTLYKIWDCHETQTSYRHTGEKLHKTHGDGIILFPRSFCPVSSHILIELYVSVVQCFHHEEFSQICFLINFHFHWQKRVCVK